MYNSPSVLYAHQYYTRIKLYIQNDSQARLPPSTSPIMQ